MRRLLLLRHAKTEAEAPSGRDFDRRLDDRGLSDADAMGQWLARQSPRPQRVLVSPAMRAQQTWRAIAPHLPETPDVIAFDEIYDASLTDLMRTIRTHGGDAATLMLVGHNPGLHELGLAFAGSGDSAALRALADNLPTAGLVTLDFEIAGWIDVGFRRGQLGGIVTPKSLRDAAHPAR